MRDASLDEFVDAEGEASEPDTGNDAVESGEGDEVTDAGPDGGVPEGTEPEADLPDPDEIEPAEPTFDFAPDGADCEACGETVRRRWRDGDGMVCPDCKAW